MYLIHCLHFRRHHISMESAVTPTGVENGHASSDGSEDGSEMCASVLHISSESIEMVPENDIKKDSRKWKCDTCTLLNPVQVEQCIACLAWKPKGAELIVDKRDEHSDGEDDSKEVEDIKCLIANPKRSSGSPKMDIPEQQTIPSQAVTNGDVWICRRCTLENNNDKTRCDVCETPRKNNVPTTLPKIIKDKMQGFTRMISEEIQGPKPKRQVSQSIHSNGGSVEDTWICSHCTYKFNPSWAEVCDLCQSVKQVYGPHNPSPSHRESSQRSSRRPATITLGTTTPSPDHPLRNVWICPKCDHENQNLVRDCADCGHLRKPTTAAMKSLRKASVTTQAQWICSRCTFRNSFTAHVCGMCQSKRESSAMLPSGSQTILISDDEDDDVFIKSSQRRSSWICPRCTFSNKMVDFECRMCGVAHKFGRVRSISSPETAPMGPPQMLQRQGTICMEQIRKESEKEAMEQWHSIVGYCKIVCLHHLQWCAPHQVYLISFVSFSRRMERSLWMIPSLQLTGHSSMTQRTSPSNTTWSHNGCVHMISPPLTPLKQKSSGRCSVRLYPQISCKAFWETVGMLELYH